MNASTLLRTLTLIGLLLAACGPAATPTPSPAGTDAPPRGADATPQVSTPTAGAPAPTAAGGAVQPNLQTAAPVQPVSGMPTGTAGYPWWNDTVFYEIFVRSYADSDGDGIGDLNGLISKLDYLNDGDPATTTDLGVTGLWLMPIHPSPSYHGYDVLDYFQVNPQYGTLEDFKRLLAEAHARGIRVLIDYVPNHTSRAHPWFEAALNGDPAYRDWYVWSAAEPTPSRGWHPSGNGDYYYGFFWEGMPDLNYANPAVGEQMKEVARYWLEEVGVDGLRVDAVKYLFEEGSVIENSDRTHAWLEAFRPFYKGLQPEALLVGEIWDGSVNVLNYTEGDELDLGFNFDLAKAFTLGAATRRAQQSQMILGRDARLFPPLQFATFLTNHDQDRVMSVLGDNVPKAKMAAALLLTAPGVPFLYYGEEIGLLGKKPDEDIRLPMQWSAEAHGGFSTAASVWRAVGADYAAKNVAAQTAEPESLLSWYRRLIGARNAHAALRVGETVVLETGHPSVYALLRLSPAERVLVVINLDTQPVSEYALKAPEGALTPAAAWALTPLLSPGPHLTGGPFAEPPVTAAGGFAEYQPLAELPAQSLTLVQLNSAP